MKPEPIDKREQLGERANEFLKGLQLADEKWIAFTLTREQDAYREGREDQKCVQHRWAWRRLFVVVFCATFAAHFLWAFISVLIGAN